MTLLPAERHPLHHLRHARRQRAKALTHLAPALILLLGAGEILRSPTTLTWVKVAEVVVGAAYLGLLVRELLHLRHHPYAEPAGVAWLELAAAGIPALEGYHIWHRHHLAAEVAGAAPKLHLLPWLYGLVALAYLAMAFNAARLAALSGLHLDATGFRLRPLLLRPTQRYRWADWRAIEPDGPAGLLLHPLAGGPPQQVDLAKYHQAAALRERILAHASVMVSGEMMSGE